MRLRDGVRLEGQVEVSVRLNIMDIFIERQIEVRLEDRSESSVSYKGTMLQQINKEARCLETTSPRRTSKQHSSVLSVTFRLPTPVSMRAWSFIIWRTQ